MPNATDAPAASKGEQARRERMQWGEEAWRWLSHYVIEPVPWLKIFHFFVAVLISGILWYLLKFSREYSVDISYPLEVKSPPAGYILTSPNETKVRMRVRGNGYTLMRYRTFTASSPLEINLQELGLTAGEDTVSRQCLSRAELERILSPQIPPDLTLEHFATERLCVELSRLDQRKLPVIASARYTLRKQFAQFTPMRQSIDSVMVAGPAAELAKMAFAYTDTVDLGEIYESQRFELTLPNRQGVQYRPSSLTCEIPVSQFTQKRLVVPIRVENAELFGQATLLPGAVELTCSLPIEAYARVKAEDFTLKVRFYAGITPERLLVELERAPNEARNVSFSPQYVSYLIAK